MVFQLIFMPLISVLNLFLGLSMSVLNFLKKLFLLDEYLGMSHRITDSLLYVIPS
jgi:hypothetical protein